jgi:hypothetical protein
MHTTDAVEKIVCQLIIRVKNNFKNVKKIHVQESAKGILIFLNRIILKSNERSGKRRLFSQYFSCIDRI